MNINEKIKSLRELNHWSQDEMAEKMKMSKNGYSKLERGENKISLHRLEQIASIFGVEVSDLITTNKGIVCLIGENNGSSTNYYGNNEALAAENNYLKTIILHKDEMLAQKDSELKALREIIELMKAKKNK